VCNRVIIQYMKNTDIYSLVTSAVDALIANGQKTFPGSDGFPSALGFTQATLAHVLIELVAQNPSAADRFIGRLENLTKEI
jgi:hypothetical protein